VELHSESVRLAKETKQTHHLQRSKQARTGLPPPPVNPIEAHALKGRDRPTKAAKLLRRRVRPLEQRPLISRHGRNPPRNAKHANSRPRQLQPPRLDHA